MALVQLPTTGFIRQAELIGKPGVKAGLLPISSATLWRRVKTGEFPAPVKLSARVTAWHVAEVEAWIRSRCAA
jgi:prophage regulatory protein